MSVIDIYEEELREFIENSNREIVISEKRPDADDYYTPAPLTDSMAFVRPYQARLDSLIKEGF